MCDDVLSGRFSPKYYRKVEIVERGKPRVIQPPVFETKVVQKLLCDRLIRPLLVPKMITSNYASIKGRGTEKAYCDVIDALNREARRNHDMVVTMTDFSSYFASIDTGILRERLGRYVADERVLDLIMSFSPEPVGLSLGNELSQIPASWFPSPIDHEFKDRMGRAYFRYMDDTLTISPSMEDALADARRIQEMAADLKLVCPNSKIRLVKYGRKVTWCKERFIFNPKTGLYYRLQNPERAEIQRRKWRKMRQKVDAGEMELADVEMQWRSVRGSIASRPNTRKVLERLDAFYAEIFPELAVSSADMDEILEYDDGSMPPDSAFM